MVTKEKKTRRSKAQPDGDLYTIKIIKAARCCPTQKRCSSIGTWTVRFKQTFSASNTKTFLARRPLSRARLRSIRRIASAAAPKKWPRLFQCFDLSTSTIRMYTSCTRAVACSVWSGFS
jgi:hypothetical protein